MSGVSITVERPKRSTGRAAFIIVQTIGLTACGSGGGGGAVHSTPSPPPSAAHPPAAAPLGLTQQSNYATTSLVYRHDGAKPRAERTEAVEFKYSAAEGTYEMRVPDLPAGRLRSSNAPGAYWVTGFDAVDSSGTPRTVDVMLYKPGTHNPEIALSYTSMGSWKVRAGGSPHHSGFFTYGIATAAADVPVTGTGTYEARILGSAGAMGHVSGDARLVFDFGRGMLSGEMRPVLEDPTGLGFNTAALGTYVFTNTTFARGGATFSGSFAVPGSSGSSWFDGSFTGPGAAELMARWQAPFVHPEGFSGTIFGVWVGKRK